MFLLNPSLVYFEDGMFLNAKIVNQEFYRVNSMNPRIANIKILNRFTKLA